MPRPERPPATRPPVVREREERRPRPERAGHRGSNPALIHGIHPVVSAWTNPERVCRRLLVTESGAAAMAEAFALARSLGLSRPEPTTVTKEELDRMLPGAVHQGLALDAEPLPDRDIDDAIRIVDDAPRATIVVLDQVTDPHNVGAVLRSAAAFGAAAVVVTERHAPETTGVLAKSASGALEVVPLIRVVNLARALEELKAAGFWCLGLAEEGERELAAIDLPPRVALVMGAEGTGLRRLTRERCDILARLPTRPPIGSLNISNAAAIALYETARGR